MSIRNNLDIKMQTDYKNKKFTFLLAISIQRCNGYITIR